MSVTFAWWLVIELVGLASAPLAAAVFRNLPDAGWALTKPLGLLLLGWLIWLPLNLFPALPFSPAWIVGTFAVFALANGALLRVRTVRESLVRLFRRAWGYIALTEALFAGAFAGMLWERSFTPGVVDTEKFMDVAFLASIWRAPHLPPPDPWLSGYAINYYYFGHYLMALPAKILGTVPAVAFNLAVALTFALVSVAVFGVAANIAALASKRMQPLGQRLLRTAPAGAISALLTLAAGDLDGAQVWMAQARKTLTTVPALHGNIWAWWTIRTLWATYDWWSPSRVVPNTINEFPAFSFVLADLHAHVLALPYTALAVGLALNLLLAHGRGSLAFGGRLWPLGLGATAVVLGGLYAINGWDLPTYLGLTLLALGLQQWLAHGRYLSRDLLTNAGAITVILVSLTFLLYAPFYLEFSSPAQGVGIVPASMRSAGGDVWNYFALPALIAISFVMLRLGEPLKQRVLPALAAIGGVDARTRVERALAFIPAPLVAAVPILALAGLTALSVNSTVWPLLWSGLLVILCAALLLHDVSGVMKSMNRARMMMTLLAGCGAGLVMLCEVIYLRDVFGGSLFRMNTVFKFYYQAWLLLGVLSGPALMWLSARSAAAIRAPFAVTRAQAVDVVAPTLATVGAGRPAATAPRQASGALSQPTALPLLARASGAVLAAGWWVGLALLLLAAAVYPFQAVAARTDNLSLPRSLDGSAYMASDGMNYGDAPAIAWLNGHISGDAVIVEAAQYNEYTHLGRVSALTGLPAIIGWGGHEVQWRYNWLQRPVNASVINDRLAAVTQIYTNPNDAAVLTILRQYHVSFVYVGQAERQTYPSADFSRFARFLRTIYHDANVTIYEVPAVAP